MPSPESRAATIQLLVMDVDGVLTDGQIYYGETGEELKAFDTKDGLGIKLLHNAGVKPAIITGRRSQLVERRAHELGIETVIQGRDDKLQALQEVCEAQHIDLAQCAYMGDDLPDLGALCAAGLGMAVADASAPVREAADWTSTAAGGRGAVREACEFILAARGDWPSLLSEFNS